MPTQSQPSSPADLEAEIQRLRAQREALEQQRQLLRVEELKVLADAYARKLQAAGFTIKEGLAALKPYAHVRMTGHDAPAAKPAARPWRPAKAPSAVASNSPGNGQDLNSRAAQVLGDDAQRWLQRPHPLLGGQSPQQVAGLPGGLDKVHALLAAYARGA